MKLLNYTEGHLLDEMRKFDLRFSRVAGGRIYFAYIPTGDEWVYFKTWDSVCQYIEWITSTALSHGQTLGHSRSLSDTTRPRQTRR